MNFHPSEAMMKKKDTIDLDYKILQLKMFLINNI